MSTRFYCNKCDYLGVQQSGHQKPNALAGTVCWYDAVPLPLDTTPTRTDFDAAAYRYIRTMAGEEMLYRLITSQDRPCFDTAIAAAMGWPTVPEQAGWRPIESAPTDRDVLLYSPRFSRANVGNWRDFKGINHPRYTHWTPLPPYPTAPEVKS